MSPQPVIPLPDDVPRVTVTFGQFTDIVGGTDIQGTITVVPKTDRIHVPSGTPIPPFERTVTITNGAGEISGLIASDAPGMDPEFCDYKVSGKLTENGTDTKVNLPAKLVRLYAAAPVVDFETLLPSSGTSGASIFTAAVLSVAGLTGVVTLEDLVAILADVLGSNGTFTDFGSWTASVEYPAGAVVTYAGVRYVATAGAAAASFFNSAAWVALGAAPDTF